MSTITSTTTSTGPAGAAEAGLGRIAGLAGAAFAASVIAQNVWAGATGIEPAPDASATEVVAKFAEHGTAHAVTAAWVAANLVLLAVFVAGAHQRLRRQDPLWATVGLVGGISLLVLFAGVNVPRVALTSAGERLAAEPLLVETLWRMHGATFAYAGVALGIALLGFSLSAVRAGVAPAWFGWLGPVGAATIVLFSIPVTAVAEGAAITMAALIGFAVWMLFLLVAGIRMWRDGASAA